MLFDFSSNQSVDLEFIEEFGVVTISYIQNSIRTRS